MEWWQWILAVLVGGLLGFPAGNVWADIIIKRRSDIEERK